MLGVEEPKVGSGKRNMKKHARIEKHFQPKLQLETEGAA